MNEIKSYEPGQFCWASLATSDVPAAKKFYGELFGWQAEDVPAGSGGNNYTFFKLQGKNVCAMRPLTDEERKMKTDPRWVSFISTNDIDATIKKAQGAGGKLVGTPMDVLDAGRTAEMQDTVGAKFSVWQPRKHNGAAIADISGTSSWREMYPPNVEVAAKFYMTVFGWTEDEVINTYTGLKYHMFRHCGEDVCGMILPPETNIPVVWLTYFTVDSCVETEAKVIKLGGRIYKTVNPASKLGCFSILVDPQGGHFGVLESS